ncbi:hypothetical protein ACH5RR_024903 [Cinchona calisaya]|uniref:Uncharacterized protein n=1 Tax=Cinchona calisaya TaxID=153742 RepID=A0ABD2Z049_9GENT
MVSDQLLGYSFDTPVQAATVVAGVGPVPVSIQVTGSVPVPESFFASLGLVDAPVPVPVSAAAAGPGPVHVPVVKRKPGRPRKVGGFGLQPTATLVKKAPGRPRKVAAKNAAPPGTGVVIPVGPPKKAPGRARKVAAKNAAPPGTGVVIPVATPKLKADGTPAKRRGRPPSKNVQILGQIPVPVSVAPPAGSTLVPNVYVGEGVLAAAPAPAVKRRGRPPRAQNGPSGPNVPKTPRKLTGKPLGRPKKVASAAGLQGPSMQQTLAFNEMRSKLDFFQTSIKQSVGILKPCLDSSSSASAVGALRQLEELANLDLGSVSVQGQQPPAQS